MSDNNGVMEIYLQINGQETDADGNILFPLPILYINVWMPLDEDGHLAAGTYRVTDSYGEDGHSASGRICAVHRHRSPADGHQGRPHHRIRNLRRSDSRRIELVTSGDGVEDGIPDGTYTASTSAVPSAGEFMTGSMTDGIVFGTNYVGDFTEQGLADGFAPATAGRLDVTGHGDGTCTFEFSFLDDKGNTWDGKWTGTLSVRSSSGIKQMTLF